MMVWSRLSTNYVILAALFICCTLVFADDWRAVANSDGLASITTKHKSSMDFRISGSEAVIPVSVEAGEPIIDVLINGRGPFPMMFDTGAEDTLTPEAAAALGLKTEGGGTLHDSSGASVPIAFTRVRALRLGDAEMNDQQFAVVSLPQYLVDRGSRLPLAGFIGYELLAHFAARLDYDGRTLTLTPAEKFRYDGKGVRVPLHFSGRSPAVPAAVDGVSGLFLVDTGSTGALTLRRQFVKDREFEARLPSALRIKSIGVTGPFEAIIMRLDRFDIAGSRIDRPATRFASTEKEGLPFTNLDGSIGYEILRQFVITFDFQRRELWFEHSRAFGTKTGQGGAGFQAVKVDGVGFRVITVLPSKPAATAGILVDDVIVAVDDVSTASMSLSEFAMLVRQPAGTLVRFDIVRNGNTQPIALTLQDVLP